MALGHVRELPQVGPIRPDSEDPVAEGGIEHDEVTIATFPAAWGGPDLSRARPQAAPHGARDAHSAAKATRCQPKAIDTSSSSPLYQSLAGWAPISAVEVLEMDPTAAVVVPTTVPSTTVSIWLAVLMH